MRFVFVGYYYSAAFNRPEAWLNRINVYAGILESLAKRHTVISIEQINYAGKYRYNGVEYDFKKIAKTERLLPWRLHHSLKKMEPDIVVVHGLEYPLQVIQLKGQLSRKTKIIVQHHSERPSLRFRKLFQRLAERFVDAYLFTSIEMGLEWVNSGNLSDQKKIHGVMGASSIFYPVDREMARSKLRLEGQPVFLWVGRLDDNKDPLTVAAAFLQFSRLHPAAKLYMIYQTTDLLTALQNLKSREDVNDAIILAGKIAHPELLYWYNSADFFISGSHYEGGGIAVCEAMSCGCVPIVTNIPSFRKTVNESGFLYEPGNEKALFEILMKVAGLNLAERRTLVIHQFQTQLSFEAIASQIHDIAGSL